MVYFLRSAITKRQLLLHSIAMVALPGLARAVNGNRRLVADYRLVAAGLHVADIQIQQDMIEGQLRDMALTMENRGLASLFGGRHRMEMSTAFAEAERLRPTQFVSLADKPDRERRVVVDYDDDGRVVDVLVDNDGRQRPSLVPRELWAQGVDPLTALARLQQWLVGPAVREDLRVPIFDGRKRADLWVEGVTADGSLTMSLLGIFGYERDEDSFVSWPDTPPNLLTLVMDAETPPMPERLQSSGAQLELTGRSAIEL